jgi:hypothetical protein
MELILRVADGIGVDLPKYWYPSANWVYAFMIGRPTMTTTTCLFPYVSQPIWSAARGLNLSSADHMKASRLLKKGTF